MGEAGEGGEGHGEGERGESGVQPLISGPPLREGAPGSRLGQPLAREGEGPRKERTGDPCSRRQGCCAPRQERSRGKEGAGLPSGLMVRGQQARTRTRHQPLAAPHDPRVLATQALTVLCYRHGSGTATDRAGPGPGQGVLGRRNKGPCGQGGAGHRSEGAQSRRPPHERLTSLSKLNAEEKPAA